MSSPNPLLEGLRLPGRIFQLPSRGVFYKNGELDESIKDGEIHVQPMSALDEINMKNPDQLYSGAAVTAVFARCVKGVLKPAELLSKDVDAIMLFLRTVTYGPNYEFTARHECADGKGRDASYIANIDEMINSMQFIDPTTIDKLYTLELSTGQIVKLRPNKYQQVIELLKQNQNKLEITFADEEKNLITMLLGIIQSVDGITDPSMIEEWIRVVPSMAVNQIADKINTISEWGSDLQATCKCRQCGETFKVEIPVHPSFFYTAS